MPAGEKPIFVMQVLFSRFYGYYLIDIMEMMTTWCSFALVIAACSTPDFATYTASFPNTTGIVGLLTLQLKADAPGYSYTSEQKYIDKACTATFSNYGTQTMMGSCSTYMAFACCLIIGICFYGILVALRTTVFFLKWYPHQMKGKTYAAVTYFLAACIWLLPIANWIMYDMVLNDYKNARNGGSSALLTASWCLAFVVFLMCLFRHLNVQRLDDYNQNNKVQFKLGSLVIDSA